PMARFFSARTGQQIDGPESDQSPKVIIWAVGRSRQASCQWPPQHWLVESVIDLNYTLDSPGLEYAETIGADYTSGKTMFVEQGLLQRKYWNVGDAGQ
ncbi:MAG: shikimate synthase, partial [Bdellovibrionales bacterium]|nr:shikimate synthase [Bdellovibrionales bacterium]